MILKAIKILPYLLPTTANVTMGVLNTRDNQLRSNYNVSMEIEPTIYEAHTVLEWVNTYVAYRYYTYASSNTAGTYLCKSISTTNNYEPTNFPGTYYFEFGQDLVDPTKNDNPKSYTLIKYTTAWMSIKVNFENLMIGIGLTVSGGQSVDFNIRTNLAVMEETPELNTVFNSNWMETNNLYQNHIKILNSMTNATYISNFQQNNRQHWNDDDILWDQPGYDYPNINTDVYLQPAKTYYIGIETEIENNLLASLEEEEYYYDNNGTFLTMPTLNIAITGTPIINYPLTEVVDIPGLMFTVLTMPFSFISQAFNITLFPNTIYSVNVSGIFLSIIALLVFAWIIKLVLRTLK